MADKNNIPFIGTGWSFPPEFAMGSLKMSSGAIDIQESLFILLSTKPGERFLHPEFGCDLDVLLFEPIDLDLEQRLEAMIRKAILLFEARITVDNIVFDFQRENGVVNIDVQYTIRTTNTRTNIVYPFYLTEGTNI